MGDKVALLTGQKDVLTKDGTRVALLQGHKVIH